jgi:hypothetical protein
MHLLKAIKEFPARRLARSSLPAATALEDACKMFQGAREHTEEDNARLSRILVSFEILTAASLGNRDIRFVAAAIGSHSSIGANEVTAILAEVERRRDDRLIRSIFKSLLANYRDDVTRDRLRTFVAHHFDGLTPSIQRFVRNSRILEGEDNLALFGKELSQSRDILPFLCFKGYH